METKKTNIIKKQNHHKKHKPPSMGVWGLKALILGIVQFPLLWTFLSNNRGFTTVKPK